MAAAFAFTDYWGGRGAIFIIFGIISLVTRLAARSRRSKSNMQPPAAQPPYQQPPYQQPHQQQQYQQQPPPPSPGVYPTSPLDGPRTNPQNPFAVGPSDRPRSTPLPDSFGD